MILSAGRGSDFKAFWYVLDVCYCIHPIAVHDYVFGASKRFKVANELLDIFVIPGHFIYATLIV